MDNIEFSIENYINQHYKAFQSLDINSVNNASDLIISTIHNNKKIITCGNGGSALTASHYITDWMKMYNLATGHKFRGISLTDNIGLTTAYGNDLEYKLIFSQQLNAIMDKGDLLIVISGSGNSPNIISALKMAKNLGGSTLGVLGYNGGSALSICDEIFHVPSWDM